MRDVIKGCDGSKELFNWAESVALAWPSVPIAAVLPHFNIRDALAACVACASRAPVAADLCDPVRGLPGSLVLPACSGTHMIIAMRWAAWPSASVDRERLG